MNKHMAALIWCLFCVGGSVYLWHWKHVTGWIVVGGIVVAGMWKSEGESND